MNEAELRAMVLEVLVEIAPETDESEIRMDLDLREQIEIDSMDLLNLVIGVHERTGVDIPERDYGNLQTVDDFVRYVSEKMG